MKIMRASITMHYNREMDEEDEELSRIVHVRSLRVRHRGLACTWR